MTPNQEKILTNIIQEPVTGCWRWTDGLAGRGYGNVGKLVKAHRFSYEAFNGPIPHGLCVRHKCDIPDCVNPGHLLVGTHQQNMQDAAERGRMKGAPLGDFCKRGHDLNLPGARYVRPDRGTHDCNECRRINNASEAKTRWSALNRDKINEYNRQYRLRERAKKAGKT